MHVESVDSYEAEPELHQVWNLLCRQSACRIVSLTLRQFVLIFSRIAAPLQKVCIKQSPERGTSALKALSTWVYFQVMQTPTNLNPLQKPLHAMKAATQTGTKTVLSMYCSDPKREQHRKRYQQSVLRSCFFGLKRQRNLDLKVPLSRQQHTTDN